LSKFLTTKDVSRCPTACAPTVGIVAEADKAALRSYKDAREAARLEKLTVLRQALPIISVAL